MRGVLAPLAVKNSWTRVEAARKKTPDGMQRLLNRAAWDDKRCAMTYAATWPVTSAMPAGCR